VLTGAVDSVIALSKFDVPSDCRTSSTAEIAPPTYRVLTGCLPECASPIRPPPPRSSRPERIASSCSTTISRLRSASERRRLATVDRPIPQCHRSDQAGDPRSRRTARGYRCTAGGERTIGAGEAGRGPARREATREGPRLGGPRKSGHLRDHLNRPAPAAAVFRAQ